MLLEFQQSGFSFGGSGGDNGRDNGVSTSVSTGAEEGCFQPRVDLHPLNPALSEVPRAFLDLAEKRLAVLDDRAVFEDEKKSRPRKIPFAQLFHSKYGNLRSLLKLDQPTLDAFRRNEDSAEELPLSVCAYVLCSCGFAASKSPPFLFKAGLLFAALCPFVRWLQFGGSAAFGTEDVSNAIYGLRLPHAFLGAVMMVNFACYPVYDVYKRWRLLALVAVLFGDDALTKASVQEWEPTLFEQARALNEHGADLLATKKNLHAFWVLVRTVGPTYLGRTGPGKA